jgi:hypothetical protein
MKIVALEEHFATAEAMQGWKSTFRAPGSRERCRVRPKRLLGTGTKVEDGPVSI